MDNVFSLVLESRSMTVYIPGRKLGDDIDQQMTFPVQCSFWSFVDMDSSSKRNAQKASTIIGQMVRHMFILLLNLFREFSHRF
jgi:hypothetical protein